MIVYDFAKYADRARNGSGNKKPRLEVRFIESRKSIYLTLAENLAPAAREDVVKKMSGVKGVFYAASTGDPENNVRVLLDDAHYAPDAKSAAEKLPGVVKAEYGQVPTIVPPRPQTKILQAERTPAPAKKSWLQFW